MRDRVKYLHMFFTLGFLPVVLAVWDLRHALPAYLQDVFGVSTLVIQKNTALSELQVLDALLLLANVGSLGVIAFVGICAYIYVFMFVVRLFVSQAEMKTIIFGREFKLTFPNTIYYRIFNSIYKHAKGDV